MWYIRTREEFIEEYGEVVNWDAYMNCFFGIPLRDALLSDYDMPHDCLIEIFMSNGYLNEDEYYAYSRADDSGYSRWSLDGRHLIWKSDTTCIVEHKKIKAGDIVLLDNKHTREIEFVSHSQTNEYYVTDTTGKQWSINKVTSIIDRELIKDHL